MAQDYAKKFYRSKAWQQCRESYISKVHGLCERCQSKGKITPGYIVHGNSTGMLTSSTKLYHDQTMRLVITVQDFPSLIGAQVVLRYRHDFGDIQEIKNHVLTPLVLTENTVSVRFNFAAGSYLMWLWITFPDGSSLPTSIVKFRVHEEGT